MGFTGSQMADSAGVSVGTNEKPTFEYSYLGGRCRHYKLVGQYFYSILSKSYHISRNYPYMKRSFNKEWNNCQFTLSVEFPIT